MPLLFRVKICKDLKHMYPQYIKLNVDHDWPEATTAHTEAFETY